MAGVNPYIQKAAVESAQRTFTVTFRETDPHTNAVKETVFNVEPSQLPYGRTGEPGSLLDIAYGAGIEIDHACGGVCACATCHVIVRQGLTSCNPANDDEEDQIDEARGVTPQSRLGCQCVPNGTQNLVVEIPTWNRNAVKEGH
jgi:2Fe-2S ferredoxin